jgi:hypothetical protein
MQYNALMPRICWDTLEKLKDCSYNAEYIPNKGLGSNTQISLPYTDAWRCSSRWWVDEFYWKLLRGMNTYLNSKKKALDPRMYMLKSNQNVGKTGRMDTHRCEKWFVFCMQKTTH